MAQTNNWFMTSGIESSAVEQAFLGMIASTKSIFRYCENITMNFHSENIRRYICIYKNLFDRTQGGVAAVVFKFLFFFWGGVPDLDF